VSLSAVVEKAWFTIGPSAEKRVFTMTDGTGGSDTVSGDPDWLCEVFTNILRNAVQYTESEGSIQALLSRSPCSSACRYATRAWHG
jgi:signal transduction histidine kinase